MTSPSSLSPIFSALQHRLNERDAVNQRRRLSLPLSIDFCSNDYLGWARRAALDVSKTDFDLNQYGATGSRLLSGQAANICALESRIAAFHDAPCGLLFNSGFDANLGVLSSIGDRHTVFLYDELAHASLIDGMRLSMSRRIYKFRHNDVAHLRELLLANEGRAICVVVESVYSMDGDLAPLTEICDLIAAQPATNRACLVVDEAHGTGVVGAHGEGLVQHLNLQHSVDVRIHTYGKAMGCHGAVVLGSPLLIDALINFARSFIYSTALPPASYAAIEKAYDLLMSDVASKARLDFNIAAFKARIAAFDWGSLGVTWLDSITPIQGLIIGDVERTHAVVARLHAVDLDVRPIFAPTVPLGSERLRICLHAFNTLSEFDCLFGTLHEALKS